MLDVEAVRTHLMAAETYTDEDIEAACRLAEEYHDRCEQIADECERDCYPRYGDEYDRRCSSVSEWFDEELESILLKYELMDGCEEGLDA
ncbi:MAG: hypothetical protein NC489_33550 [Ruminococcus flavefaciens]|nr:hypothetical protein [Ruminococcus flavefaciens]